MHSRVLTLCFAMGRALMTNMIKIRRYIDDKYEKVRDIWQLTDLCGLKKFWLRARLTKRKENKNEFRICSIKQNCIES
jgi:hypothetical protein